MRLLMLAAMVAASAPVAASAAADYDFGLFDFQADPGDGWQLMSVDDFKNHADAFRTHYNANNGLRPIKLFHTGNCCFAVKGGKKLTISGTPYGYQFPAAQAGGIRCNPTGGFNEARYLFYKVPSIAKDAVFGSKTACATSHNPAVFMKRLSHPKVEFAIFDHTQSPGDSWKLVSLDELKTHRTSFVSQYNNGGLPVVRNFVSGNCCVSIRGGKKLIIAGTPYGFLFPAAAADNKVHCSLKDGYTAAAYKFYRVPSLTDANTFAAQEACVTNHNPGIFMREEVVAEQAPVQFGLYDFSLEPGGGWKAATSADINAYKAQFVDGYNKNRGLNVVKNFKSGNCCVALAGGNKLIISGTAYGYQFPSNAAGDIRCNPSAGYTEGPYLFYRSATLTMEQTFTEKPACATSHNPSVFIKLAPQNTKYEYGIYDYEKSPGAGWELLTATELEADKEAWFEQYNNDGGLPPVASFTSGNCCFATKGGEHLIISGTPYGYQFPAALGASDIRCNPTDGYSDSLYTFFRVVKLATSMTVSSRANACALSHNPAIFRREQGYQTTTTLPPTTTTTTPAAVHCQVSQWAAWQACSHTCGDGMKKRTRQITREDAHGGDACPALEEDVACHEQDCPVHCEMQEWGSWGDCNANCGGGVETRTRGVKIHPNDIGTACPHTSETRSCNTISCPIDCVVTSWTDWTSCDVECGGGTRERRRMEFVQPQFNGQGCPHLLETEACNTHECPVHCTVSDWGAWGDCDASCGGGKSHRARSIIVTPKFLGTACPSLDEDKNCAEHECPVHCEVGAWHPWGACSVSCGGGTRKRTREVTVPAAFQGDGCPELEETDANACSTQNCPVHCEVSTWGAWSGCSKTCGAGSQTRARSVATQAAHGGNVCAEHLTETQDCLDAHCPIHCELHDYSAWGSCSTTCGTGTQTRTRDVRVQAEHGGNVCDSEREQTQDCLVTHCPVHCEIDDWQAWGSCDKTCGAGTQKRMRGVKIAAMHGGNTCTEHREETRDCPNQPSCPIHCDWHDFSQWGSCTHSCGSGTQTRSRLVKTAAQHGGNDCPGAPEETQSCNTHPCPVDCVVADFPDWDSSPCTVSCGGGVQTRSRTMTRDVAHGGVACPHLTETQACNDVGCPVHCDVGQWTAWSTCTRSCGGGYQARSRSVETPKANGGDDCPDLSQSQACNAHACPVDCVMEDWNNWSTCTVTCGGGSTTRSRGITTQPQHGGVPCEHGSETESCATEHCPTHCTVSTFSPWSTCTKSCGGGSQSRARSVVTHAQHGGYNCPHLSETQACNAEDCAVDCLTTDLSAWSTCTATCGGGTQSQSRTVTRPAAFGGVPCPSLEITKSCGTSDCPVDCVQDGWQSWGGCTATCGGGSQTRSRNTSTQPAHGGVACGASSETQACNDQPCPVDCVLGAFSEWGACTKSCDGGRQSRSRSVVTAMQHNGTPCEHLDEGRDCNSQSCPIDCQVGSFNAWGTISCTKTCGTGYQTRTRVVTVQPQHGGVPCPSLSEQQQCNTQPCPIDCQFSDWASWEAPCDKSCGGGHRRRTRSKDVAPAYGGVACPSLEQVETCNSHECPVDCIHSEWASWGACSVTCGIGEEIATRSIVSQQSNGGVACGALAQSRQCDLGPCPIDCEVTDFGAWGDCSLTCGSGSQVRTRSVTKQDAHGGSTCPALQETQDCNAFECAIDCVLDEWGSWSTCSKSCNGGTKSRSRLVVTHPAHGGVACAGTTEEQSCNQQNCPIDCAVETWSAWGSCSASCDGGSQTRSRGVTRDAAYGGVACPGLQETMTCNTHACPVDCQVSAWGDWSTCSVSCGAGEQLRMRSQQIAHAHGGTSCPPLTQTRGCNAHACPIDCVQTSWTDWGGCSRTCGTGTRSRTRSTSTHPSNGGVACGDASQSQNCNEQFCPVDCVLAEWGAWSTCSASCGTGHRSRTRGVNTAAGYGGVACASQDQSENCNTQACPVDCVLSAYSDWSSCSVTCGAGTQTRSRSQVSAAAHGGAACDAVLSENQHCTDGECPIHCETSSFTAWSPCSVTCGGGSRSRSRSVVTSPQFNGDVCPHLSETETCSTAQCPVDCVLSDYGNWDTCSRSCGGGSKTRHRSIDTNPAHGGVACDSLSDTTNCNSHACPRDCITADWGGWSTCTASCDGGVRSRSRAVDTQVGFGGAACGHLSETAPCNQHSCPVDCDVSDYSDFTACTKSCGGGRRTRSRSVITAASDGGAVCPGLEHVEECNTHACPTDCVMNAFAQWGSCSVTCGGGVMTRSRTVKTAAGNGGAACPAAQETQSCNDQQCPVDCIVSTWSEADWSTCTKSCGGGTQTRTRSEERAADFGGVACPPLQEQRDCNSHACPVDCQHSAWSGWGDCSLSCGAGGVRHKTRSVQAQALNGGVECSTLPTSKQVSCNLGPCPVHCVESAWTNWSSCSKSCGGGQSTRTRWIVSHEEHGGDVCGNLNDSVECNSQPCPVDCQVGYFGHGGVQGSWSPCTKSCGTGSRTQSRSVTQQPAHGGVACPATTKTETCNAMSCPVDCDLSDWSTWGGCSVSCGGGTSTRSRSEDVSPAFGGVACGAMSDQQTCNTHACPIDCQVSDFTAWTDCSLSCGGGEQTRTRVVDVNVAYGGTVCPALSELQRCNEHECPVDCVLSSWTGWSGCTHSCGTGSQEQFRSVEVDAAFGGVACGDTHRTRSCNEQPCPVDCVLSDWDNWTPCSLSCGTGTQSRTRSVDVDVAHGGKACEATTQSQSCNTQACPVDCEMSGWTGWGACSVTCGDGSQSQTRTVVTPASNGGVACPDASQHTATQACNLGHCPIHCSVSTFTNWNTCSHSCGGGTQTRARSVVTQDQHGGDVCPDLSESRSCNEHECPVDCAVSEFSDWSPCTVSCGTGTQHRTRIVTTSTKHGGVACPPLGEQRNCNEHECPVDCITSDWTAYETCSKSCGGGNKIRRRTEQRAAAHGGVACGALEESATCNTHACPVDCVVDTFTLWGTCTKSCGGGEQTRTRQITTDVAHGGVACPVLSETQACNGHPCPVDCVVTDWSTWSTCTKSCTPWQGTAGSRTRSKTITTPTAYGGSNCPDTQQVEACGTTNCPMDCQMEQWSDWGACSVSCAQGTQTRSRSTKLYADGGAGFTHAHGGAECPHGSETRNCYDHFHCPVDCVVSSWSEWTDCDKSCGTGEQVHTRYATTAAAFGGVACPALSEAQSCNAHPCPIDCSVSEWGDWSQCSVSCAEGIQTRVRTIDTYPDLGGAFCPGLSEERTCDQGPCPIHCQVSSWTHFSTCDRSCGGGRKTRTRSVVRHDEHGGYVCPSLEDQEDCNSHNCPVDCIVSDWASWSPCTLSCGSGMRSRSRDITRHNSHGGRCYHTDESEKCNEHECAVDCVPTDWGAWSVCDKSCGGGRRTRTREVRHAAQYGGAACELTGYADCNSHQCGCTHIKCAYLNHEVHNHFSIRVMHHREEKNGFYHSCGIDSSTGDCRCECSHHKLGDKLYMLIPHGKSKGSWHTPRYQDLSDEQKQHLIDAGVIFPTGKAKFDYTGFHDEIRANAARFAGLDYEGTEGDAWHHVGRHHWHDQHGMRSHAQTVAAHADVAAAHGAESDIPLAEQYNPNRRKPSYYFHTATTKSGEAARSFMSSAAANV